MLKIINEAMSSPGEEEKTQDIQNPSILRADYKIFVIHLCLRLLCVSDYFALQFLQLSQIYVIHVSQNNLL